MVRRQITLLVLALASFALAACADATGPKPQQECQVLAGSGICKS